MDSSILFGILLLEKNSNNRFIVTAKLGICRPWHRNLARGPTITDHTSPTDFGLYSSILYRSGQSLYLNRFGSRRIGKRTGIVFNDEMDDFSTPNITNEWGIYPSPANFIEPGKRPLSSMCPAIFVDKSGKVSKILGGAGGSMITSSTAWVAAHILWLGDSIDSAINRRRLHHQLLPPALQYEEGFEDAVVQGLTGLGHSVNKFAQGRSIIHGINVDDGVIHAKCDERKGENNNTRKILFSTLLPFIIRIRN
ncbi:hypothetical protein Btru_046656 [Bulinus truncatus]|nr:hypothetical protein Btru_046656 [Bulinus truncatus]